MINKICPQCGKQFEGRANKLYCSHNCKMSAFYEMNGKNELTVNKLSVNDSEIHKEPPPETISKPLTVSKMKTVTEMVTVPVQFTIPEKEMLEEQAEECDTVLPKFIRIRSLMDETDTMSMQQNIAEQREQLEELRVKLSFFQGQPRKTETVKPLTDNSVNGLIIEMNEQQMQFLKEKYLESHDYEDLNSTTFLSNGTESHNEREVMEYNEKVNNTPILSDIGFYMLIHMINETEKRLIEHCGFTDDDFEDENLYEQFDALGKK